MGFDPRQVLAGVLTLTMFVMLANMIKRDHFDSAHMKLPGTTEVHLDIGEGIEHNLEKNSAGKNGPWLKNDEELKSCWSRLTLESMDQSTGFVIFSLTNGYEYHVSQIADAVVVARYLGATLVLPDIRGSKPGDMRKFEEIYSVEKFVEHLDGVVRVAINQPDEISSRNLAVVRVPNRVTEDHIAEQIKPVFRKKGNVRLATYFQSVSMKRTEQKGNVNSVACLAMFGTLEFQPLVHETADLVLEKLQSLSWRSDGRFIAVDLRVDKLESKGCEGSETVEMKSCYSAQEISLFLKKTGFNKDTVIYLTQSKWDSSLNNLKDNFPYIYTKEDVMPAEKKSKYLSSEAPVYESIIDFHICSRSEIFVPAISGLFYANVAGKRIASGKTQILVPAAIPSASASAHEFVSHYVSKKNHLAYSCFC